MQDVTHRPEYTNADYSLAIAKIVVLSGISSKIEDFEMTIIIEFLRRHFRPRPHPTKANITINSPEYLVNIWQYGAGGSFPMPENYTKISCEYIGRVIMAFREWRKRENTKPPVYKLPETTPALSAADNDAVNKSIVLKDFERFKQKGKVLIGGICYDALVELDQFNTELYKEYLPQAEVLEKAERGDRGKASGDIITYRVLLSSISPKTLDDRAKGLAVEAYFRTIETIEELGL